MELVTLATQAIHTRETLSFTYSDKPRTVEVHALGLSTAGKIVIRGYQVQGDREGWALFSADRIIDPVLTLIPLSHAPRPGYSQNDKHIPQMLSQVTSLP